MSRRSMNFSIFPSESQVMSASVAISPGFSRSRWIGRIGKSWSIAHESGTDWKTEKLTTYLSASSR